MGDRPKLKLISNSKRKILVLMLNKINQIN